MFNKLCQTIALPALSIRCHHEGFDANAPACMWPSSCQEMRYGPMMRYFIA